MTNKLIQTVRFPFGLVGLCIVCAIMYFGCSEKAPNSLYNPQYTDAPAPVLTSITPAAGGLAGVTQITIVGTGFSTTPAFNQVWFNATLATVLNATPTQLIVRAPVLVSDSIKVVVSVSGGSEFYSNALDCKLEAAVVEFGTLEVNERAYAIATDTTGNLYANVVGGGVGTGVTLFNSTGARSGYSSRISGTFNILTGMKMGWGGALFYAAHQKAIIRVPPGGGTAAIWATSGLQQIDDLDFDQNGNMWAAGISPTGIAASVFRVRSDKSVHAFAFRANVRSVRVFDNYLYLSGIRDSVETVWRLPIIGDSLGAEETYFQLSSMYPGLPYKASSITFATDGSMFIATDAPAGIILVDPTRSGSAFYPGLITSPVNSIAWTKGPYLFASIGGDAATNPGILRINTEKSGAPYAGATLP